VIDNLPALIVVATVAVIGINHYSESGDGRAPLLIANTSLPPPTTHDIVCFPNPQADLETGHWRLVALVDRQKVTDLVGQGRAELREEESLVCIDYTAKPLARAVVKEQWWRLIGHKDLASR